MSDPTPAAFSTAADVALAPGYVLRAVASDTFSKFMRNSAILPTHRRRGLYSALMRHVIGECRRLGNAPAPERVRSLLTH